ncbi:FadR/GntR family transcriptional regulator [Paenibacillus cisolokensis]|jgi:Transcriptional regulators|uniref:GntR family transcriptional regulator n=1 Tax=Paenibacillus cisolokensis TaxID=1658519 RepID=A0ABQ4N558_9BACL|nr:MULTISPECIES: FadR/GntR family transcriptional regulator [Paenibacillus]ALS27109.1 GntR family transcriptional regulator [Paenibacillus sp. 32O-W]GIQ63339.1 GntR family transcriptional regulator [Paenibacillus cisolokensis]
MPKIRKQHVHELVAQEIQNFIREHRLKEGDRLPSVAEMTELFGVGRSSLREALRYLEAIGIVRVENGKGVFVRDAIDAFRFSGTIRVEHERRYLLAALDVRRALEGKAVELAAKRITPGQVKEIEQCLKEYKRLKENGKDTSKIDFMFHMLVIKAAGNPVLESVLTSVSGMYERFFNEPLGEKRLFDETYPYHFTMFEGIAAHDVDRAMTEFHKLMDSVESLIRKYTPE